MKYTAKNSFCNKPFKIWMILVVNLIIQSLLLACNAEEDILNMYTTDAEKPHDVLIAETEPEPSFTNTLDNHTFPDEAILCYFVRREYWIDLCTSPSIEWVMEIAQAYEYMMPNTRYGYITWIEIGDEFTGITVYEVQGMSVGPYYLDAYYYSILSNNHEIALIIGGDMTGDDILFTIIIEYMKPSVNGRNRDAYFGVKTMHGDYFLRDEFIVNNDDDVMGPVTFTHNWKAFNAEDFSYELRTRDFSLSLSGT